jgi:hypothetical protein
MPLAFQGRENGLRKNGLSVTDEQIVTVQYINEVKVISENKTSI